MTRADHTHDLSLWAKLHLFLHSAVMTVGVEHCFLLLCSYVFVAARVKALAGLILTLGCCYWSNAECCFCLTNNSNCGDCVPHIAVSCLALSLMGVDLTETRLGPLCWDNVSKAEQPHMFRLYNQI